MEVFEDYYNNLKSLIHDLYKVYDFFFMINFYLNGNEDGHLNHKILECKEKIKNIYKKYSVNDYNDMIKLISLKSERKILIKDKELCKDILRLINVEDNRIINYDDTIFRDLYKSIILNNLYDPNWNIGTSEEPFYTLLPEIPNLYNTNMSVYNSGEVDWQILKNGSDSFLMFLYKYLNAENRMKKAYYYNILKSAINTSCDIHSTLRYKSKSKIVCMEFNSIYTTLINNINTNSELLPVLELISNKENIKKPITKK